MGKSKKSKGRSRGKGAKVKKSGAAGSGKAKQPAKAKEKRLGALGAAAKVLKDAKKPMGSRELIAAMADQGLWTSPAGKTPHATLYAAMHREIAAKGKEARFVKVDRGLFEFNRASA